jgi:non-heme chloroperoxidase
MPTLTTRDDTTLFYRDWGTGEPIVLCHAWAMSGDMWQYQMNALAERGFRTVAADRRGHGRSDDPGTGFDYDTLADDLAALLDTLDLRDVTFVAHSFAGGEVVRYLTRHGAERVARVAFVAATLPCLLERADNPDGVDGAVFEAVRDQWRAGFGAWIAAGADGYVGRGLPGCDVSDLLVDWQIRDMLRASLRAVIATNEAMVDADFRDELRQLAVRTLVVHGDHDLSAPFDLTGRRTAALVPNGELVLYEHAPHGLYLTHRDRLTRDLAAFAGQVDGRAGSGRPTAA